MSTVQRVNLEPRSDLFMVQRRDFPFADPSLANPLNAVAIVDGEWISVDANGLAVRATTIGTPGDTADQQAYVVWAERGRSDVQTIRKIPTLYGGWYEADTRIFDAAAAVGGGAAITTMGQALKVATITLSGPLGGRNYSGLVGAAMNDPLVVGYVSKLPSTNGGWLRFTRKSG